VRGRAEIGKKQMKQKASDEWKGVRLEGGFGTKKKAEPRVQRGLDEKKRSSSMARKKRRKGFCRPNNGATGACESKEGGCAHGRNWR